MMQTEEAEGMSGTAFTKIEIPSPSSGSIDSSVTFHVVNDILAFVLFMHQQIPSILQDIDIQFEELHSEHKDLDAVLAGCEIKGFERRKNLARKREVKQGIRRLDKLMTSISCIKTALQLLITDIPDTGSIVLILGPSPLRPLHVYELSFQLGRRILSQDFSTKNKLAAVLSKKAIRALISRGAGSDSYNGPTKLFLLIRAPASFSLPLHFLPKRDFR